MKVLASTRWVECYKQGEYYLPPNLPQWVWRDLSPYCSSFEEITKPPLHPYWYYSPLRDVLLALNAPLGTTYIGRHGPPIEHSCVAIKEYPSPFGDLMWESNSAYHLLYTANHKLAGIVLVRGGKENGEGEDICVYLTSLMALAEPEQFTLTNGDTKFERALAEGRERLYRDTADYVASLKHKLAKAEEQLNNYKRPLSADITDPRVVLVTKENDYRNNGSNWIVIKTNKLICKIGARRFALGKCIIGIWINDWSKVYVLANSRRERPHPHMMGDYMCLGDTFARTAREMQTRGYFSLYVTLLLDHLENGVDPQDPVGNSIFLLPEIDEEGNVVVKGDRPEVEERGRPDREADYLDSEEEEDWLPEEEEWIDEEERRILASQDEEALRALSPQLESGVTIAPSPAASPHWVTTMPSPNAGFEFVLVGSEWIEQRIR